MMLDRHFAATIGLPAAAAGAFVIIAVIRQTDGPLEFEALGVKFRGASGPIILWVLCFAAMAAGIWLLWPSSPKNPK
jgi:hypothetical protein